MNVHWEHKKQRSANMSNNHIDDWYDLARKNGALGGKMIGAGGGGFLMFYADDKMKLRHAMRKQVYKKYVFGLILLERKWLRNHECLSSATCGDIGRRAGYAFAPAYG